MSAMAGVWISIGLLLLALSRAATANGENPAFSLPINGGAYGEDTQKILLAERVTLWMLIDTHEEFLGKYVQTQGYLATVDQRICLFPSKEYYEALFLHYATAVPPTEDPYTRYAPRSGDYVEIIARVTENRRWNQGEGIGELFDKVVQIDESLAVLLRRYPEQGCYEQCERYRRNMGHPPANKSGE